MSIIFNVKSISSITISILYDPQLMSGVTFYHSTFILLTTIKFKKMIDYLYFMLDFYKYNIILFASNIVRILIILI